jgi:hypothetical protein
MLFLKWLIGPLVGVTVCTPLLAVFDCGCSLPKTSSPAFLQVLDVAPAAFSRTPGANQFVPVSPLPSAQCTSTSILLKTRTSASRHRKGHSHPHAKPRYRLCPWHCPLHHGVWGLSPCRRAADPAIAGSTACYKSSASLGQYEKYNAQPKTEKFSSRYVQFSTK